MSRTSDLSSLISPLAGSVSSVTDVYYPGDPDYLEAISHWASSSTELSACAVVPGTAADVGIIVKSGGYSSNPGFSSTIGVHIWLTRLSEVTYDPASQTVVIGAGLIWDDVYAALQPFNVTVAGGRTTGQGVGGHILGGGYSYLTNQYGLTVDTVTAFELVRPDGQVVTVTQASDPDLEEETTLSGVVTRFTLQTFPPGQVWGGSIQFAASSVPNATAALLNFNANVVDPKASVVTSYNFALGALEESFSDGIFDEFLAIPYSTRDISTRSFLSLVQSGSVLSYTPEILEMLLYETTSWEPRLARKGGLVVSYTAQPSLPSMYTHNTQTTAFPPNRSLSLQPFDIYAAWTVESFDEYYHQAVKASMIRISNAAVALGQTALVGAPVVHPNYAMYDTPLADMYGDNLPALRNLKFAVDPQNVMRLSGGFKF
ncbi:hypothetical protein CPB84DRAFT_1847608 [Gymnopilus junonius]|uniref:FAD-binding PCMH-type domain-containing protein n=1 Tax=Gymnopilus junonius TaxID=109634 RepID=A0A9P5NLU9_GYMJU|nr:hypothetical protein CPB84DRAFT_1847608 [Gymnopilus junonius]